MKKIQFDLLTVLIILSVVLFLANDSGRELFLQATSHHVYLMGFLKFGFLATLGELLAMRILKNEWTFKNIKIGQRFLVWGILGIFITFAFSLFSFGVIGVVDSGYLPAPQDVWLKTILSAFYKSFIMNMLFGFPLMVTHRITDTLIEKNLLFSDWPFIEIWKNINWENMFRVVGFSLFWFWVPAHTITFLLPSEFRIIMAAMLSIALGVILAVAKLKANTVK